MAVTGLAVAAPTRRLPELLEGIAETLADEGTLGHDEGQLVAEMI